MSERDVDVPNLSGRLAVVTGASDGLGLRLAHRLARAGAEVIMPVRNEHGGQDAIASITRAVPAADLPEDHDRLSRGFAAHLRAAYSNPETRSRATT